MPARCFSVAAAAALLMLESSFAAVRFEAIPFLPGTSLYSAASMSADGSSFVGSCFKTKNEAFRWTRQNGIQLLGVLPGKDDSYATCSNADGSVVLGYCTKSRGMQGADCRAFRWTPSGGLAALAVPGPPGWPGMMGARPSKLTADGSIFTGYVLEETDPFQDISYPILSINGVFSYPPPPASQWARAFDVSSDGSVVVGQRRQFNITEAVRWTSSGMQALGFFPGHTSSSASLTSTDGSVVIGYSTNSSTSSAMFRWTSATGKIPFAPIPGDSSPGVSCISANGSIAGGGSLVPGSAYRAALWTSPSNAIDVKSHLAANGVDLTGWSLRTVSGMSADGTKLICSGVYGSTPYLCLVDLDNKCPADLTVNTVVDDADFVLFASAYNTLDCADTAMPAGCSADLNRDHFVDDADFSIFAAAYDVFFCP